MMFDCNLMGKGYAYSNIRNVTVSLSPDAAQAFLTGYGPVDPLEKAADEVVSHITTLILDSKRQTFPGWAEPSRAALHDIPTRIEKLIQSQSHDIPVDRTKYILSTHRAFLNRRTRKGEPQPPGTHPANIPHPSRASIRLPNATK